MKISLRPYTLNDAQELSSKANNPKIAANLTDGFPNPYTLEHAKQFIKKTLSQSPTQVFAIIADGEIVGSIGVHPQEDIMRMNAELGYWITEEFWGKGIATKGIEQIVSYAFENFAFTRIYARPFGRNVASQRVLEKCGFTLEARFDQTIIKNGKMEDELIYAIRKDKL